MRGGLIEQRVMQCLRVYVISVACLLAFPQGLLGQTKRAADQSPSTM